MAVGPRLEKEHGHQDGEIPVLYDGIFRSQFLSYLLEVRIPGCYSTCTWRLLSFLSRVCKKQTKECLGQEVTCAGLLENLRAAFVTYHLRLWSELRASSYVQCLHLCTHCGFLLSLINTLILQAVAGMKEGHKYFSVSCG